MSAPVELSTRYTILDRKVEIGSTSATGELNLSYVFNKVSYIEITLADLVMSCVQNMLTPIELNGECMEHGTTG